MIKPKVKFQLVTNIMLCVSGSDYFLCFRKVLTWKVYTLIIKIVFVLCLLDGTLVRCLRSPIGRSCNITLSSGTDVIVT